MVVHRADDLSCPEGTPQSNVWIKRGDRSHANLKVIDDELRNELTYHGRHEDLKKLEGAHLSGDQYEFDRILSCVREKQRVSEGNRSHPHLVKLDALRDKLTYEGWANDYDDAIEKHTDLDALFPDFDTIFERMRRKQAMSVGDFSHDHLRTLNSLKLSFPGWKAQMKEIIECHRRGLDIGINISCLVKRQRVFEGIRCHPRLVALDSLSLSYPGWQKDAKEAERIHIEIENELSSSSCLYDSYIKLLEMKERAYRMNDKGPWIHPVQKQIIQIKWTYRGWHNDVEIVRTEDSTSPHSDYIFKQWLEKCILRQLMHQNNYSEHPALRTLDKLQLSYPGWEVDFEDAKKYLHDNGYDIPFLFDNRIRGMRNKQAIYEGLEKDSRSKVKILDLGPQAPKHQLGTCAICLGSPRTHAFVPCGHTCACKACSAKVMAKKGKCPICNKPLQMAMEIFLS